MAPADIEWVFGIVRAGRDYQGMEHAKSGGAGYEFTATVIVRGRTAEIVGGAGRLTPALAKEIEIILHSQGITTAIWERYNGDPKRIVRETRGRSRKDEQKNGHELAHAIMNGSGMNGHGASLNGHASHGGLNGAAAFVNGFRPDMESLRSKPPGGCARDIERTLHQKVGNG